MYCCSIEGFAQMSSRDKQIEILRVQFLLSRDVHRTILETQLEAGLKRTNKEALHWHSVETRSNRIDLAAVEQGSELEISLRREKLALELHQKELTEIAQAAAILHDLPAEHICQVQGIYHAGQERLFFCAWTNHGLWRKGSPERRYFSYQPLTGRLAPENPPQIQWWLKTKSA